MTTYGATSDDRVAIITTLAFQHMCHCYLRQRYFLPKNHVGEANRIIKTHFITSSQADLWSILTLNFTASMQWLWLSQELLYTKNTVVQVGKQQFLDQSGCYSTIIIHSFSHLFVFVTLENAADVCKFALLVQTILFKMADEISWNITALRVFHSCCEK